MKVRGWPCPNTVIRTACPIWFEKRFIPVRTFGTIVPPVPTGAAESADDPPPSTTDRSSAGKSSEGSDDTTAAFGTATNAAVSKHFGAVDTPEMKRSVPDGI